MSELEAAIYAAAVEVLREMKPPEEFSYEDFARRVASRAALAEASSSAPQPLIEASHPEAFCDDCGQPNAVWFAPSNVWNRVVRVTPDTADPMLCPVCFIRRAERAGVRPAPTQGSWCVTPDLGLSHS